MIKEKISSEIKELIAKKEPRYVLKAKKIAMRNNIKLRELRKGFCKECYSELIGKTRIKNGFKVITCNSCGNISRWRM